MLLLVVGFFYWGLHEDDTRGQEYGPFRSRDDCVTAQGYNMSVSSSECYTREVPDGTKFDEPGYYAT